MYNLPTYDYLKNQINHILPPSFSGDWTSTITQPTRTITQHTRTITLRVGWVMVEVQSPENEGGSMWLIWFFK